MPITPNNRLPSFRRNQHTGRSTHRSPDGGVTLTQHDVPATPTPSLCASANIGRRRFHHGSLLSSPARPGHASRMKQIFEEAGLESKPSQHGVALYPQLPNISRATSPPPRDQKRQHVPQSTPAYGPGSLLPSKELLSAAPEIAHSHESPTSSSKRSSGSWSGDSGYLVVGRQGASPKRTVSIEDQIRDWLSTVSQAEVAGVNEGYSDALRQETVEPTQSVDKTYELGNTRPLSSNRVENPKHPQSRHGLLHDPFMPDDSSDCSGSKFSTDGSNYVTAGSYRPPPSARSQRHISDVCKRLILDQPPPAMNQCTMKDQSPGLAPVTPLALGRTVSINSPNTLHDADDGGIELSPLSPNVCIERGPSRYHSDYTSPRKLALEPPDCTPTKYKSEQMKANVVNDENMPQSAKTLRILGSARRGARFWPPPGATGSLIGR